MSKQYNKAENRKRRNAYIKRKKAASRPKTKATPASEGAAPATA
jgi:hypothetical protein